ncbi:uncharacterized protein LOC134538203 [Bacillus rossius redtenbacheri]|uniref:uncharacterized protein LOC134538203 n=1 Tax=Bacillus rossius redtenbacheri TaxID=93214 RepID=UPI002FDCFDDB
MNKMACLNGRLGSIFRSYELKKNVRCVIASWGARRAMPYSTKEPGDEDPGPVKFSQSKAAAWKAQQTRSGGRNNDAPYYQPVVISASLAVFMLYFCVFREENDLDEEIGRPLFDRIEGLKAKQLEIALKYNREHGLPTEDLENELHALGIVVK